MNYTSNDSFTAGPDTDDSPVGIVVLWQLLWRNRWHIAAPAFVLSVLTILLVFRSDDTYTAEAQMLLTRGNLEIVEFDSVGGAEVSQGAITNALTILGSRNLALQVIDIVDLTNDPEVNPNLSLPADTDPSELYSDTIVRQVALDWLASVTRVNILPGSNAILVRVTTTGPGKSAAIANAYVDAYLDYQVRRGQEETERAAAALETRVNELSLQLEADQARLQGFRVGANSGVLAAADTLTGEAVDIRTRLETTEARIATLNTAVETLEGSTADTLRNAIDSNETLLRLERSTLGRAISPQTAEQDTAEIDAALQIERARLIRLGDALREGLAAIETRISEANAFTVGLRQLEVEVETTSQVYETSLARLKELVIQTGLRDAGAQILARAEAPLRTDAQGRRRMVAIAGALGLFIGIAYVLLREAANDRVRRVPELIEITGSDTIVELPPETVAAPHWTSSLPFMKSNTQAAPFQEGVRALRHRLMSGANAGAGPIVAGVFSSLPTEGRSGLTRALASSFALIDRRVVVVDGDMRAGLLSKHFGVPADHPGLQQIIAENVDLSAAILSPKGAGYDVLPSGRSTANPADLLESHRFGELVVALRERYDVILFDTPPILVLPDATKIAAQLNMHILVVDHDRSPRAAVRDASAALHAVKVDRPIVAFCNAPKAFGQRYGYANSAYTDYWTQGQDS